jgi:hypothetical protein
MEKIFNLEAIRAELDSEEWEEADGLYALDDSQSRRVFLGTIQALTPSGKVYLPWACSNVDICEQCKGSGRIPGHHSRKVCRRNKSRYNEMMVKAMKHGYAYARKHFPNRMLTHNKWEKECPLCHGMGSREAYLDEEWNRQAAEELDTISCGLEYGEGDPCDLFAIEYRSTPDSQEVFQEESPAKCG